MAIKVGGTEVIDNSRALKNIASIDAGTTTVLNDTLNTDPTKATLTKSFLVNEIATMTLSSTVSPTAVVAVTKEVGQTGVSSKGGWDVNATASNYELYEEAPATSLTFSPGWDLSTAYYWQTKSISAQESAPTGVFFKPDGTRMYIVGSTGDDVNQYSLSTAWDITTAALLALRSVSAQDTAPQDFFFKPDGTKMYVVGSTGDAVYEYDLSTAWDVTTASYLQGFSVAAQDTGPTGISFKPDGTKMYVVGTTGDAVNEYDLSTAWDISTASYVQNFSVSAQETTPQGISFKPDGTKMHIVGATSDAVHEYDLSTAWDVSTASYLQNFSVAGQDTAPTGVFFKPDGTKMYIIGTTGDAVYEYNVSGTFSLGTGSFSSSDVGKRIYVDDGGEAILTATSGAHYLVSEFGASSYTSGNWSLSGLDVDATDGITLSETSVGTWDISKASLLQSFSVFAQEGTPTGLFFKPDGTKMYVIGSTGDAVNEYDLSTAWDVSTASHLQSYSVSVRETAPQDLFFKPDGTKMYIIGSTGDDINIFDLSTAWDISTASYSGLRSIAIYEIYVNGFFFKPDGTKIYFCGDEGDDVTQFDLSPAWDLTTFSNGKTYSVVANPDCVFFKPDGTKMYTVSNSIIYEYDLSTAWDVSTASLLRSEVIATSTTGIFFKPTGDKLYAISAYLDTVSEYDVGVFAQTTAQYLPAITSSAGQIDSTYWTDINSMTADDVDNDGQVYYAVSTDDRTTWSVAKASDGERDIVRNNGGTWEYNSNATYSSTTWTSATTNNEFAALAEALGATTVNQMDKVQLDAVTDGSHFTLGNTLDLAVIPYLVTYGTAPTSDGVSINYDAAVLNKGAILGTDYDYDVPETDKVRITSLATQNLKVRIV